MQTQEMLVIPELVVDTVVASFKRCEIPDVSWFKQHAVNRLLYLYENNPKFKRWMSEKTATNKSRDMIHSFVNHWLDAYVLNPVDYKQRSLFVI